MFEEGGTYSNRRGRYMVLALNPPKMSVRYEDGSHADLNISIQERIWENILVEEEAKVAIRQARANRRAAAALNTQFFIKVVSLPAGEYSFPGWQERVVLALGKAAEKVKSGDRLIHYAIESQTFFAVSTITGPAVTADPKEYFFTMESESEHFFPVDIDVVASSLETAVALDSVELESQPNFIKQRIVPEMFVPINEDDFELLAELLTEIAESEEEDVEDDDDIYDEEDED